jgi:hypothetical protein
MMKKHQLQREKVPTRFSATPVPSNEKQKLEKELPTLIQFCISPSLLADAQQGQLNKPHQRIRLQMR